MNLFPARSSQAAGHAVAASSPCDSAAHLYKALLGYAFATFNSLRLLTYLPTILAIVANGGSDQHSLLMWMTWVGANATMATWLYERNDRHVDTTVLLSISNAGMCLLTGLVIVWYRL